MQNKKTKNIGKLTQPDGAQSVGPSMRAVLKRCPLSALYDAERKCAEKHGEHKSSLADKTKTQEYF